MTPRSISQPGLLHPEPLRTTTTIEDAVRAILAADVPALPVVDESDRYAGVFGEREFMAALFPGYVSELRGAAYLSRALDGVLEKREACRRESVSRYMHTEHVEVGPDFGDTQVAEIFLHHRVLIVPVVQDGGRVTGIVTRHSFFTELGRRFLGDA